MDDARDAVEISSWNSNCGTMEDGWSDEEERDEALLERLQAPDAVDNLSSDQRSHALVMAARQGRQSLAFVLVGKGASVNAEDEFGCTPLMFTATHGHTNCLQQMLAVQRCIVNKRSHNMQTALHFAAKNGQVECIKLLLGRGAMVNVSDDWGETPLMLSVRAGSLESVQALLAHGANTAMINLRGLDALTYAAQGGSVAIMELLLQHGSCDINKVVKTSPLHQAAVFGHVRCVQVLLAAGVKVDVCDVHGRLPIELATQTDKHEVVKVLVQHGTAPEYQNSALAAAAKANGICSVLTLLQLGADPAALDMQGLPAFFWATAQNNIDIVKIFIRHNVDVNKLLSKVYLMNSELRELTSELDLDFVTAVIIAAFRDHSYLVRVLTLAGARVSGVLALHEQSLLPQSFSERADLIAWLELQASRPQPLASLCRQAIRDCLPPTARCQVKALPLPRMLQDFLQYSDLDLV